MKRLITAFLALFWLGVCAPSAVADNYPIKDGNGASRTFGSKSSGGVEYPKNMFGGAEFIASGVTPVSSGITSPSTSASFTPVAGRTFHVQLTGTAIATCYLERQLDGSTWTPITITGGGTTTTLYNWNYAGSSLSEDVVETQVGVPYRLDCGGTLGSYTSGTLTVKFSQ